MGLKPAKGQGRATFKMNTFRHGERYDLYNVAQAVPKRPVTAGAKGRARHGAGDDERCQDLHAV